MDIKQAKHILEVLADGVDPSTGEILPYNDSSNNPEVVRALYVAIRELERSMQRSHHSYPENYGKPWQKEDELLLSRMYDNGATASELCKQFKRTKGSIAARLVQLGKIPDRHSL